MMFEWDDVKARANLRKHGISFETASLAFEDSNLIVIKDRVVAGEQRWHAIGSARGEAILLVVHTVNDNDEDEIIRIIAARRATRHESRTYQDTRD
jgi:uncharacterized DUF497 family protein